MATRIHGAWLEYAREQAELRRREQRCRSDVTGEEALDRIISAIGEGRVPAPGEALRARLSSERRERAHDAIRARHAPTYEDDMRYRSGQGIERIALSRLGLRRMPSRTARILSLDAQGLTGAEVARSVGASPVSIRQCLSRASRGSGI